MIMAGRAHWSDGLIVDSWKRVRNTVREAARDVLYLIGLACDGIRSGSSCVSNTLAPACLSRRIDGASRSKMIAICSSVMSSARSPGIHHRPPTNVESPTLGPVAFGGDRRSAVQ
jgi:hypothetical protein